MPWYLLPGAGRRIFTEYGSLKLHHKHSDRVWCSCSLTFSQFVCFKGNNRYNHLLWFHFTFFILLASICWSVMDSLFVFCSFRLVINLFFLSLSRIFASFYVYSPSFCPLCSHVLHLALILNLLAVLVRQFLSFRFVCLVVWCPFMSFITAVSWMVDGHKCRQNWVGREKFEVIH